MYTANDANVLLRVCSTGNSKERNSLNGAEPMLWSRSTGTWPVRRLLCSRLLPGACRCRHERKSVRKAEQGSDRLNII